jgi:hypothetical protein
MLEYQTSKSRDGPKYTLKLWRFLLPIALVMSSVIFLGDRFGLVTGEPVPSEHWIGVIFIESLLIVAAVLGWRRLKRMHPMWEADADEVME